MEALDTTLYEEGTQVPLNPHTISSQVSHKDTTVKKALEETVNFTPQELTPEQQTQARENINALEDEAGVIDEGHIATGAVTTPKIAKEAVTDVKLAPLSVGASRIKDLAVTTPKIANKAVTTEKIAEKAVTVSRIVNGAVTTPKIADRAVTSDKIADGAVGNDKIADGAITNAKIRAGAVSIDKLNTDLQSKVNDNVKTVEQTLTAEQKAQARKNIDVDYLTEDEVANLWGTTN